MKMPVGWVRWLLPLPLLLSACVHKTNPAQVKPLAPPIAAPEPAPAAEIPPLPSPVVDKTPEPEAKPAAPQKPASKPPVQHKKPVNRNTQIAANAPPSGSPGVSAIGQLSSGDPSDQRLRTENAIAATERGLNGVNRKLSDSERKTAAQIAEFLKQARIALASGDMDGARTLAAKAKVLLNELSR
jgi:outer membrane biosynthesis protein TonB